MSETPNGEFIAVMFLLGILLVIVLGLRFADRVVAGLDHLMLHGEFRKPPLTREEAEFLSDDDLRKRYYDPVACDERIRRHRIEEKHTNDPIWQKTQKEMEGL